MSGSNNLSLKCVILVVRVVLDSWGTPYKTISQKINEPTTISTLPKINRSYTIDWENTAEELMNVLVLDDKVEEENGQHQLICEKDARNYETNMEATFFYRR